MNPTRRLLHALLLLLGLAVLLGLFSALEQATHPAISNAWWGLLLCLGLAMLLDALALRRMPSPDLQRSLPGNLALGRWHDVRLQIRHALPRLQRTEQLPVRKTRWWDWITRTASCGIHRFSR